jgi:hypothetical protein
MRYGRPVDFLHPIEAVIPGARGRVLAALVGNTSQRSVRQLALSAGVSPNRAGVIVEDLAALGIVERAETPGAVLVRLSMTNAATGVIRQLADLRRLAVEAMKAHAALVKPAPMNLTIFGSFARGGAGRQSDIDVVAVRPEEVAEWDDPIWADSIAAWVTAATRIAGNPIHLIDIGFEDVFGRSRPDWLMSAIHEGVTLAGDPLERLVLTKLNWSGPVPGARSRRRAGASSPPLEP